MRCKVGILSNKKLITQQKNRQRIIIKKNEIIEKVMKLTNCNIIFFQLEKFAQNLILINL